MIDRHLHCGAGVHLKRAFGFWEVPLFDPFLLLDDFRSDDPAHFLRGFPLAFEEYEKGTFVKKGQRR